MSVDCLHVLLDWLPSGELTRLLHWQQATSDHELHGAITLHARGQKPTSLIAAGWRCTAISERTSDWLLPFRFAQLLRDWRPRRIALWNPKASWLPWACRWGAPEAPWWASFHDEQAWPGTSPWQRWLWKPLVQGWVETPAHAGQLAARFSHQTQTTWHSWPWSAIATNRAIASRTELQHGICLEHRIPLSARLLLTVGPLSSAKQIEELFWAVEQASNVCDDLYLLVVGSGPDQERLRHYAELYRIEQRVRFVGYQPDVQRYFQAADLYLTADPRAEFAWATRTAVGIGCPVIALDRPWHRAVITPGRNGWLVNEQYRAELARAIVRWYQLHVHDAEVWRTEPLSPTAANEVWAECWSQCAAFGRLAASTLRAPHPSTRSAASSPL